MGSSAAGSTPLSSRPWELQEVGCSSSSRGSRWLSCSPRTARGQKEVSLSGTLDGARGRVGSRGAGWGLGDLWLGRLAESPPREWLIHWPLADRSKKFLPSCCRWQSPCWKSNLAGEAFNGFSQVPSTSRFWGRLGEPQPCYVLSMGKRRAPSH